MSLQEVRSSSLSLTSFDSRLVRLGALEEAPSSGGANPCPVLLEEAPAPLSFQVLRRLPSCQPPFSHALAVPPESQLQDQDQAAL